MEKTDKENVQKILDRYGQGNCPPISFTEKLRNTIYHFELGSCFGLVAYKGKYGSIKIHQLDEDDVDFWVADTPICKCASHIKQIKNVSIRMEKWLEKNCTPLYYAGLSKKIKCGYKNFKKKLVEIPTNRVIDIFGERDK